MGKQNYHSGHDEAKEGILREQRSHSVSRSEQIFEEAGSTIIDYLLHVHLDLKLTDNLTTFSISLQHDQPN